jgi:hypothetical protein
VDALTPSEIEGKDKKCMVELTYSLEYFIPLNDEVLGSITSLQFFSSSCRASQMTFKLVSVLFSSQSEHQMSQIIVAN